MVAKSPVRPGGIWSEKLALTAMMAGMSASLNPKRTVGELK
jgi:hypothetical protein